MKTPRTNPRTIDGMARRSVPPTKFPKPKNPCRMRNGRLCQMTPRSNITSARLRGALAPTSSPTPRPAGADEPGNGRAALDPRHDRGQRDAEHEVDQRAGRERLDGLGGVRLDLARLEGQLGHADRERDRGVLQEIQ